MALDFNCGSNVVTGFSRNNPRERGQERECLRATTSARGRPTEGEITGELHSDAIQILILKSYN